MILEQKLIEIRDKCTFIPALATAIKSDDSDEAYLLRRAGYGRRGKLYIFLAKIDGGATAASYDAYGWGGSRTMTNAHLYLIEHWDAIKSGDVVDVAFILGETATPKVSERLTAEMA